MHTHTLPTSECCRRRRSFDRVALDLLLELAHTLLCRRCRLLCLADSLQHTECVGSLIQPSRVPVRDDDRQQTAPPCAQRARARVLPLHQQPLRARVRAPAHCRRCVSVPRHTRVAGVRVGSTTRCSTRAPVQPRRHLHVQQRARDRRQMRVRHRDRTRAVQRVVTLRVLPDRSV
jgi:hypothetical protein